MSDLLEQAYASHAQDFPHLHHPNVAQGTASEQDLRNDVRAFLGGVHCATIDTRIMDEVEQRETSSSKGRLFNFTRRGRRASGGESSSSFDQVIENIVRDYTQAKRAA